MQPYTKMLLIVLASVLVAFLLISVILMVTFNAAMNYFSAAFNFGFNKQMGILEAMAVLIVLWIVGAFLFKSMEKVIVTTCTPMLNGADKVKMV